MPKGKTDQTVGVYKQFIRVLSIYKVCHCVIITDMENEIPLIF